MHTMTDELASFVERARQGDRSAVEALLSELRPGVLRYCRAKLGRLHGSYGSADDVTQEVCMAVVTALPRWVDQGRPFTSFVYGIAAHKVADAQRHSMRDRSDAVPFLPESADAGAGPEELAVGADEAVRALALLDRLPAPQREVLLLRVVAGLSAEETAAAIGSTAGAVRVAQHRALARLRAMAIEP